MFSSVPRYCVRTFSLYTNGVFLSHSRKAVKTNLEVIASAFMSSCSFKDMVWNKQNCLSPLIIQTRSLTSTMTEPIPFHNSSPPQPKSRSHRHRQVQTQKAQTDLLFVYGFSTAEEYDLERLRSAFADQGLNWSPIETDDGYKVQDLGLTMSDVLHVVSPSCQGECPREAFFFREGSAVFWNVSDVEASNFLRFLQPYQVNPYDESTVILERESMSYRISDRMTSLQDDSFTIAASPNQNLEKYTFSNAIALSVKLGIWETLLEKYVESIEHISEDLKSSRKVRMSREQVLQKQGELLALRHLINLSSDLLDVPDFYWDNDDLEKLYLKTVSYFSIQRRTKVMNEKLNHCLELVELVSSHVNDKHHVRLEWMVISLIMVEVLFEMLHFMYPR